MAPLEELVRCAAHTGVAEERGSYETWGLHRALRAAAVHPRAGLRVTRVNYHCGELWGVGRRQGKYAA